MNRFYGKYRGKVVTNVDPMFVGRLQVRVPSVLGTDGLSWAMPCVPFAGPGVGWWFLPPQGANIWVEFEGGDPDYAIWTGGFWLVTDPPPMFPPAPPSSPLAKGIKTDSFTLSINEAVPGAPMVSLEVSGVGKIAFSPTGMEITASPGTLALNGTLVQVNTDGLVVK